MKHSHISLSQRITQANTRMHWISRRRYLGQMTKAQFETERAEILDFIAEAACVPDSDVELDPNMHAQVMPKPIKKPLKKMG